MTPAPVPSEIHLPDSQTTNGWSVHATHKESVTGCERVSLAESCWLVHPVCPLSVQCMVRDAVCKGKPEVCSRVSQPISELR